MKKIVAITLALLVLAGCSSETFTSGLGMVNSIGSSKSATEEAAGLAQADVTAASVMLDSKGTIVGISFDVVQTKVNFDATGTITTDLATEFKTKKELKEQRIIDGDRVLESNFNKSYFTKIDIRVEKEIKLYSKYAKILTMHPSDSYTLEKDANKQYVLRITNPQIFWSTSKYLVILVK